MKTESSDRDDDHHERGLRAPDHARQHVVAARPSCRAGARALGGLCAPNSAVLVAQLVEAVRRDHRREAPRSSRKKPVITRPVTSMPRCSPTLCWNWWTTGSRFQSLLDRAHQYLTRGSMSAAMMSTMKLVSATITASRATMPCTATKSRFER